MYGGERSLGAAAGPVRPAVPHEAIPRLGRQAALLWVDALGTALALYVAVWLRFDGKVPLPMSSAFPVAVCCLVAIRVVSNAVFGLHLWSFRLSGLPDALRVAAAGVLGSAVFVLVCPRLAGIGMPRTVYALEFFLATATFGALRFTPRVCLRWAGQHLQARSGAARTIIVGAGDAAELLARDVQRSPNAQYRLVGLVAENASMAGCRLDGSPVLGVVAELPSLIRRHEVTCVLLADPSYSASRIRQILDMCATSRVRFKIIPASLQQVERLSVAMLDDVSAEDLLPRACVPFDDVEIRSLVRGRTALVTGAGGSIGSELSRQLARHGVAQLVMVDMNENELYLNARRLVEQFPETDTRTEVADVREAEPILRLGRRYRPQYVFHAAAHKHVPLMEIAPDEAVKNNVFGTLNVARMADACGAEQFVLISTDKAVNPTSVMGATKRVAELVMRDLGRSSKTQMTAVRFGNVLGSAGSVVPIFKEQIARGGPVTVTHPDCTRYFMTIPEAVGLVLLAGLGAYGELCILDMGEPIRIDDLARNLITMSGHVPQSDVPIVYTGLRPGEKLHEELLTEQEEKTQAVRNRIKVARCPAPPPDLGAQLVQFKRVADAGDREGVIQMLRALVPTFHATPCEPTAAATTVASAAPARPHGSRPRIVPVQPTAAA